MGAGESVVMLYLGDTLNATVHLVNSGGRNVTDENIVFHLSGVTGAVDSQRATYRGGGNYAASMQMSRLGNFTLTFSTDEGIGAPNVTVVVRQRMGELRLDESFLLTTFPNFVFDKSGLVYSEIFTRYDVVYFDLAGGNKAFFDIVRSCSEQPSTANSVESYNVQCHGYDFIYVRGLYNYDYGYADIHIGYDELISQSNMTELFGTINGNVYYELYALTFETDAAVDTLLDEYGDTLAGQGFDCIYIGVNTPYNCQSGHLRWWVNINANSTKANWEYKTNQVAYNAPIDYEDNTTLTLSADKALIQDFINATVSLYDIYGGAVTNGSVDFYFVDDATGAIEVRSISSTDSNTYTASFSSETAGNYTVMFGVAGTNSTQNRSVEFLVGNFTISFANITLLAEFPDFAYSRLNGALENGKINTTQEGYYNVWLFGSNIAAQLDEYMGVLTTGPNRLFEANECTSTNTNDNAEWKCEKTGKLWRAYSRNPPDNNWIDITWQATQ
jgi:hypothetical protein